jgi:hypothetical protein
MSGWLSFVRWLKYEVKGRRYSFPLDNQAKIYKMREAEEDHDRLKTIGVRKRTKSTIFIDEAQVL